MLAPEDVRKVAVLARLKLTDDEISEFSQQIGQVLDYVAVLNELDVSDVEPMAHAAEVTDVLRADATAESLSRDDALSNAPKTDGRFFLVPQILENA